MTTFYAPEYRLPRATKVAATLQLAALTALTLLTTLWSMLAIAFLTDDGQNVVPALLLALVIALPAPSAAVTLLVAMVRSRRRGAPPLVHFEIATCSVVAAVFVAAGLGSAIIGHPMPLIGVIAGVGPAYVVYLALAAAVILPLRRQRYS